MSPPLLRVLLLNDDVGAVGHGQGDSQGQRIRARAAGPFSDQIYDDATEQLLSATQRIGQAPPELGPPMHGQGRGHLLEFSARKNFQARALGFSAQAEEGRVEGRLLTLLACEDPTSWSYSHVPQAAKASCLDAAEAG
jgi:hypothetical protein